MIELDNYKNLLSIEIGNYFSETIIRKFLSEKYIDFNITVLNKNHLESKSKFLFRNLDILSDEQVYETLNFLGEKINSNTIDDNGKKILEYIDKMNKQFPEYSRVELILNLQSVEETKHWLVNFPESLTLYNQAEKQYIEKKYHRNLVDNLRLSLELLLKSLTGVNKSIENQNISDVLSKLRSENISKEFINMFHKLIEYYTKYNNTFVKHDDNVPETEIEVIFEITSTFMKFLIREVKI